MSVNQFWDQVRKTEQQLVVDGVEEQPWLVSVETPRRISYPGRVTRVVDRRRAAQLIVEGTHQVASEEQVAQFQVEQERQRSHVEDFEARREGRLNVPLPSVTGVNKDG